MQTYGFVIPVFNHPHYLDELMAALSQYHLPKIVNLGMTTIKTS